MMLKPCYQVGNSSNSTQIPFHYLLRKPFVLSRPNSLPKRHKTARIRFSPAGTIKAVASSTSTDQYNEEPRTSDHQIETETITVKAVVTVQPTVTGFFKNLGIDRGLDDIQDLLGKSLLLELVSAELDPSKIILINYNLIPYIYYLIFEIFLKHLILVFNIYTSLLYLIFYIFFLLLHLLFFLDVAFNF